MKNIRNESSGVLVRKEFIINFLIVLGSLILIAIICELFLRLFGNHYDVKIYEGYPQGALCKPDRILGWIGNPKTSGVLSFAAEDTEDMHVVMNSEGFWDINPQIIKPSDAKRILFLGDSFTIGFGVSEKDRFSIQ